MGNHGSKKQSKSGLKTNKIASISTSTSSTATDVSPKTSPFQKKRNQKKSSFSKGKKTVINLLSKRDIIGTLLSIWAIHEDVSLSYMPDVILGLIMK